MPSGTTHQRGRQRNISSSREARETRHAAAKKIEKTISSSAETTSNPRTLPDKAGPGGKRPVVARKNRPSAGYDPMTSKWINHRQRGVCRTVGIGGGDSGASEDGTYSVTPPALYFR